MFVANHSGFLDGPVVYAVSPRWTAFLVKKEMFDNPFGIILRMVGQIPIDRAKGDRDALSRALAVLKEGGAVGVFPEGTRGAGEVAEVQQGAAWVALQSGARMVPVACLGTRGSGGKNSVPRVRSRLVVVFGDPFTLVSPEGVAGRQRLRAASDQRQNALAAHVARARTGVRRGRRRLTCATRSPAYGRMGR